MAISPISHDDVWAVGAYGTVAHWNGTEWIGEKIEGVDYDLLHVAANAGGVYAAGTDKVIRYDGHRWRVFLVCDSVGTAAVLPSGDVAIPAGPEPETGGIYIAHGERHDLTSVPGPRWGGVRTVTATSDRDVWAIDWGPMAHHFDGTKWTNFELPNPAILDAAAVTPNLAYLVGANGLVMRGDGTRFQRMAFPSDASVWTIYAPPGAAPYVGGADGLFQLVE